MSETIYIIYPKPDILNKKRRYGYSITIMYLSAILKKNGYKILYSDFSKEKFELNIFNSNILKSYIILIEFDTFALKRSQNIKHANEIIDYINKNYNNKPIIAFGKDCILNKINISNITYTFKTDPEWHIIDVIKAIKNRQKKIQLKNKIKNLDFLPFPDRSIINDDTIIDLYSKQHLQKSTIVETSRGCNNTCTFCQRKGWNNKILFKNIDNIVNEFKYLKSQDYKNVWIVDENFTFNLSRAKNILTQLKKGNLIENIKISISSWSNIDKEFLILAKKSNISIISFGIESADENILKFYKKNIDLEKLKELIHFADNLGIYLIGNFILGAPKENQDTINKTFNYIKKLPFDDINIKILDYMIGSDLYESLPDHLKDKRHYFACKENNLNNYLLSDLIKIKDDFYREFLKNNKTRLFFKINKFGEPYYLQKHNMSGYSPIS